MKVNLYWQKNKPGMQGGDSLEPEEIEDAKNAWRAALYDAITHTSKLSFELGLHKQVANRLLMPFMHMNPLRVGELHRSFR